MDTMSHEVYYQFLATPGQARRAGARGGKATARNRRQRLDGNSAQVPQSEAATAPPVYLRPPPTPSRYRMRSTPGFAERSEVDLEPFASRGV